MPTLNVKCGPMLRYDTCVAGVWLGYALLVLDDATSQVSDASPPTLQFLARPSRGPFDQGGPAAVRAGENAQASSAGVRIHTHQGAKGAFSFWRFKIEVPQQDVELAVTYSIDGTAHPNTDSPAAEGGSHTF